MCFIIDARLACCTSGATFGASPEQEIEEEEEILFQDDVGIDEGDESTALNASAVVPIHAEVSAVPTRAMLRCLCRRSRPPSTQTPIHPDTHPNTCTYAPAR